MFITGSSSRHFDVVKCRSGRRRACRARPVEGNDVTDEARNWAIIMAGGAGHRLRPLTRLISGDDRPKQYCRVVGRATMLGATRARLSASIRSDRTLCVVNRAHDVYYRRELVDLSPAQLVE